MLLSPGQSHRRGIVKKPDTMFSSLNQEECQYYELQSFMTQSTHLPVGCLDSCLPPLHTDRQFAALSRQVTVGGNGPVTNLGTSARLRWPQSTSRWFCQDNAGSKTAFNETLEATELQVRVKGFVRTMTSDSSCLSWVPPLSPGEQTHHHSNCIHTTQLPGPSNPFSRFSPPLTALINLESDLTISLSSGG